MTKPKLQSGSVKCAWKACKRAVDVKNSVLVLDRNLCKPEECRPHRAHAKSMKFCCAQHLANCRVEHASSLPCDIKGREALTIEQFLVLFHTVRELGAVWAAVLMLIQLFLGERADAARQCCFSWLRDFEGGPQLPKVQIPQGINKKTCSRLVSLDVGFARILRSWIHETPLTGGKHQQWPFENQPKDSRSSL